MNEIIALQKYENEAQLAKELIRGFWLAHGDYVITDEEAAENLAAWTDKGNRIRKSCDWAGRSRDKKVF